LCRLYNTGVILKKDFIALNKRKKPVEMKTGKYFILVFLLFFTASLSSQNANITREDRDRIISLNSQLVFTIEITGFKYAKWDILSGMEEKLNNLKVRLFDIVKRAKELGVYNKLLIKITGHSDADGPFNKKLAASKKRAEAVVAFLIRNGFDKKIFKAFWKADNELKNQAKPKSAVNRRVVINFSGFYIPALGPVTGDRVVDRISELGFKYLKYYNTDDNKELKPNPRGIIEVKKKGVVKIRGRLISYLPGDKVIIRVRNINTPVNVNPDGSFEASIVIYRGKNYVTSIQQRGSENIRRSDIINIVSEVKKSVYQFQLKWEGFGDLDLIVRVNGKSINYMVRKLEEKYYDGELDIDNRYGFGPENIRIYKAPRGAVIKVYIDYYANIPWKKRKWYFIQANYKPLKYTLYVFSKSAEVIKTVKGEFSVNEASMETNDMRLVGTFVVH
jgi:outer membrane protein OmpA-like peptidoglycan-associated protein/uncharacterized protein YfaP (DUF2135 family)